MSRRSGDSRAGRWFYRSVTYEEPMRPPDDAQRIVSDVAQHVSIDEERLRKVISARFEPGRHWHDLMEAERLANEVVADAWGDIALECDEALTAVHERYLDQAAQVLEAHEDLRVHGADSWIGQAVVHHHAFQLAWDVLDEKGLLTELPD
jgi:hypothetical protein